MNLYEIILVLEGFDPQERERQLSQLGVDRKLRPHIHACYDRNTYQLIRSTDSSRKLNQKP